MASQDNTEFHFIKLKPLINKLKKEQLHNHNTKLLSPERILRSLVSPLRIATQVTSKDSYSVFEFFLLSRRKVPVLEHFVFSLFCAIMKKKSVCDVLCDGLYYSAFGMAHINKHKPIRPQTHINLPHTHANPLSPVTQTAPSSSRPPYPPTHTPPLHPQFQRRGVDLLTIASHVQRTITETHNRSRNC